MPVTPVNLAPRQKFSRRAGPMLALVAVLITGVVLGPPAEAQPPCHVPRDYATVQEAIDESTCDTIHIAHGTYEEIIRIDRDVTIRGAGENNTVIDGGGGFRPVTIIGGVVTIENITIQNGLSFIGGAIRNAGELTLKNSTITNNEAIGGGGIVNQGGLTIKNSTITDNEADFGGGLANSSSRTAILQNSTVSNNTAFEEGDDIYNEGSLTLRNVTFNECVDDNGGDGCPEP